MESYLNIILTLILAFCSTGIHGYQLCANGITYCETGYCCNSGLECCHSWGAGSIAGTVIGVLVFIGIVVGIYVCCRRRYHPVVVQQTGSPGVTVVNTNNQMGQQVQYPGQQFASPPYAGGGAAYPPQTKQGGNY
ncbi:uncharacterized protein LOC128210247 [Mya arenaria]|uniref:uncharacterized protein LOC128210247 n=1 Tax=Mya arenaria TaxID=6604 RepID=UPI0022E63ED6|nr:uncharacterized protein LOC128210247 [Mya arenaria]